MRPTLTPSTSSLSAASLTNVCAALKFATRLQRTKMHPIIVWVFFVWWFDFLGVVFVVVLGFFFVQSWIFKPNAMTA